MKALALLLFSTVALAQVDNEPSMLLRHKTLAAASDQVITMCANQSMEIVQQTRNTVVCHLLTTTLRFTLVQLSTGVRVAWTQDAVVYRGLPVGDGLPNALIQGVMMQADPGYRFAGGKK